MSIGQVIVIAGLAFAFGMGVIAMCKTRNYDKGYNDGYKKGWLQGVDTATSRIQEK